MPYESQSTPGCWQMRPSKIDPSRLYPWFRIRWANRIGPEADTWERLNRLPSKLIANFRHQQADMRAKLAAAAAAEQARMIRVAPPPLVTFRLEPQELQELLETGLEPVPSSSMGRLNALEHLHSSVPVHNDAQPSSTPLVSTQPPIPPLARSQPLPTPLLTSTIEKLLTLYKGHDAAKFGAAAREVIQGRPSTASASTSSGDATSLSAAPPVFVVELEGLIERHSLPKHSLTLERIVSLVKQLALHEPPPYAVDFLTKPTDATLVHNLKLHLRTPELSFSFVALAVEVARAPSLNFQVACIRHGAKPGPHLFAARAMALAWGRVEPVARELLGRRLLDLDHSTPIDHHVNVTLAHSMAAEVLLAQSSDVDAAVAHLEAQGDGNEGLDEDEGGNDDKDDETDAIDRSVEDRSYAPHRDEVKAIAASDGSEQVPSSSNETGLTSRGVSISQGQYQANVPKDDKTRELNCYAPLQNFVPNPFLFGNEFGANAVRSIVNLPAIPALGSYVQLDGVRCKVQHVSSKGQLDLKGDDGAVHYGVEPASVAIISQVRQSLDAQVSCIKCGQKKRGRPSHASLQGSRLTVDWKCHGCRLEEVGQGRPISSLPDEMHLGAALEEVGQGRPISSLPNAMHLGAALAAAEAAVTRQIGRCDLTELVVADPSTSSSQPAPLAATNVARSAGARMENSMAVAAAVAAALQDRASASSVSTLHRQLSAMVQTHVSSPSLSTLWPAAREATSSAAQAVATPMVLDFQIRSGGHVTGGDVTAPVPHDASDLEETVDGVKLVRSRKSATGYKGVYFMQSAARHGAHDESSDSHAQEGRSIFHARGVEGAPSGWDTALHGVWQGESRFLGYCT